MDIFEYLPQLIVAYDSDDEFANLIHVKKAILGNDYYCPCCGGTVRPRALDSNKEQSHYWHQTGKCTKESQLHFFCKNWLFEEGSKFYINDELFEVISIDIEKAHSTPFGDYKPDITVYTTNGKTIYFEIFFTNRKTGDDYFCKWEFLGNSVVEVNIKEYMFKTDSDTIPYFTYLYHDGVCYSKPYVKRDLYANTIARIKHELTRQKVLNYKARIEQLDWFWQEIRNNTRESILEIVSKMEYEDMVSCYEIIKRKQCVSYLKDDILSIINQKVVSDIRKTLELPYSENIYFDLEHVRGRTYKAGIRLKLKTEHIVHNKLYMTYNSQYYFDKLKGFPKIVFDKNIFDKNQLTVPENNINDLRELFEYVTNHNKKLLDYEKDLSEFEGEDYKVRVNNDLHTVLVKTSNDNYEILLDNYRIESFDIDDLSKTVEYKLSDKKNKEFLIILFASDEYNSFLSEITNYDAINVRVDIYEPCTYTRKCNHHIHFKLYINEQCVYNEKLEREISNFIEKTNECKLIIQDFMNRYNTVTSIVERINGCRNKFWKAQFYFDWLNRPTIEIDQKYFIPKRYLTKEKIYLHDDEFSTQNIISLVESGMKTVLKNMERCGYRVMEVRD